MTSSVRAADQFLTIQEVAEVTRISIDTLRWWRHKGSGGPKSFRLGRRVMYTAADVQAWIDEQRAA